MAEKCFYCGDNLKEAGKRVTLKQITTEDGQRAGRTGYVRMVCLGCGSFGFMAFCLLLAKEKKTGESVRVPGIEIPSLSLEDVY